MSVQTSSAVLPTTVAGVETSDIPFTINDSSGKEGYIYSLYFQDAWRIVPSVTINGGLRFDDLEAFTSNWQLSPCLNAVWTATPTTTVHAGYARYFTPPPLVFTSTATYEKFINTTNAPPFLENATIRPERANYYLHAGVTQQIIPGFKVGLDGYYKQAEDLLDDGQFGAPVFLTPLTTRRRRIWASS